MAGLAVGSRVGIWVVVSDNGLLSDMEVFQRRRGSAQQVAHNTRTAWDHTTLILLTVCPGGRHWPS